jgi:hypothetical protein
MTAFWSASLIDPTGFEFLKAHKTGLLETGFVLTRVRDTPQGVPLL